MKIMPIEDRVSAGGVTRVNSQKKARLEGGRRLSVAEPNFS